MTHSRFFGPHPMERAYSFSSLSRGLLADGEKAWATYLPNCAPVHSLDRSPTNCPPEPCEHSRMRRRSRAQTRASRT
eukprot:1958189-Pleurochrysis_carterae.AAC.1